MKAQTRVILVGLVLASGASQAQNLFTNPGFEDPITFDGPPFVGFWEGFSAGGNAFAANSSMNPLSGSMHADISILGDDNSFAGVFQDVAGLAAGQEVTFSGWHARGSQVLDVGIEFRIEWRDSINNVEINRTPNSSTAPSSTAYEMFSLTGIVPAGADTARVVYAIQTFGGDGPTNTGTVYLDDMNFIPAPGSLGLLAGAGLVASRRRRA